MGIHFPYDDYSDETLKLQRMYDKVYYDDEIAAEYAKKKHIY